VGWVDGDVLVPPYRRIADEVRDRIARGELRPGDRVPSARQITKQWGVAIATATKALAVLRDEGLTTPRTGVGTVVATPQTAGPARRERDLDRDRVVRAAIAIADADGMAEVSMRRIAGDLGVATMSLYRHVPSKDELVLAMIDAAYGEVELPVPRPAGWRTQLELCARVQWAMFHRHPWLAGSMSLTRPQLAPHAMRTTEWILQALGETGLSFPDRMYVHVTLFSFIRGVADALEPEAEAIRETGITNDEWMNQQNERFIALIGEHELPTFRRFADADFDLDLDSLFEFGLARLLDGLGVFIDSRPR
jgi:DNA-binding transcriptional regulator YhcF (GntR family)